MEIPFGDLRFSSRRRTRATALQAVWEYSGRWGWAVAAGAPATGGHSCGCGNGRCAAPGLHPAAGVRAPEVGRGTSLQQLRALWDHSPAASVILPCGRAFDVLDVPGAAGYQALVRLERMGTRLGPVLASPTGRALFFVAPGAAGQLPGLLYRMGWDDAVLDLHCHGEGSYVAAPPTVLGALGPMRWLRPPTAETAAGPPEARLLLGTLAYACHRSRGLVSREAARLVS